MEITALLLIACFILLYVILIFVIPFMNMRNEWVFKKRIEIIKNSFDEYDNYISYNEMVTKWWIWDIEKMRNVRE
jgi:hypothetical protein